MRAAASSAHKGMQQPSRPAPGRWSEFGEQRDSRVSNQGPVSAKSWDFAKIPIFPAVRPKPDHPAARLPGVIQRKVSVGRTDDPLEHEADSVADRLMCVTTPEVSISGAPLQISRKCAACQEEQTLHKKSAGYAQIATNEAPATVYELLRSPGRPLNAPSLAYFEPRFGRDLSEVRVHTGAAAERSARDVNAHAYTVGRNIVFGAGRFVPSTEQGRRLIAHELTHVVQQSAKTVMLQRAPDKGLLAEPKPIRLLSLDSSGPEVCGGRPCVTDTEIYAGLEQSRAEDAAAEAKATAERKRRTEIRRHGTKQQNWELDFDIEYSHLKNIGARTGPRDAGIMTDTGVRVPRDPGDFLAPRPFYERRNAAFLAYQGFIH